MDLGDSTVYLRECKDSAEAGFWKREYTTSFQLHKLVKSSALELGNNLILVLNNDEMARTNNYGTKNQRLVQHLAENGFRLATKEQAEAVSNLRVNSI